MDELERLNDLLDDWKKEKQTNQYGMAFLADRAIKVVEDEIDHVKKETVNG
jgi:hypothetical protein